jgi:mono/diheme cytochrome c family protein
VADARLLAPGAFTLLHVTIDTFAKRGRIRKQIWVSDDQGHTASAVLHLTVRPSPHMRIAGRSLFDAPCAACHAAPVAGQHEGARIYAAVCSMCHGADAGGAYAPSLRGRHEVADLTRRIGDGTGKPSMPGFARRHGGPLDAAQLRALSLWLASLH